MKDIIIAIDGHSSSGKSSFAKAIAAKLGYTYFDTGAMYRAITLYALRTACVDDAGTVDAVRLTAKLPEINIRFQYNGETQKSEVWLNGENVEGEIRLLPVSNSVSRVSAIAAVRKYLVEQQRQLGLKKALVMDGRDIGTVVFPQAEVKIFLTASPAIRARRRYEELIAKGEAADYEQIEQNIIRRDYMDETRAESPLRKAPDALVLDNSDIGIEEQMDWAMWHIAKVRNRTETV
jgi:cytidylate kinase